MSQNLQNHCTELQVLQKNPLGGSQKSELFGSWKWCGVSKRKNNFQKVIFPSFDLQETNISQEGILFLEGDIKFMTFSTPPNDIKSHLTPPKTYIVGLPKGRNTSWLLVLKPRSCSPLILSCTWTPGEPTLQNGKWLGNPINPGFSCSKESAIFLVIIRCRPAPLVGGPAYSIGNVFGF